MTEVTGVVPARVANCLLDLLNPAVINDTNLITISRLVAEAFNPIEGSKQWDSIPAGSKIPTGFADIDAMTLGLTRGSLVVLAGSTGIGKTALALNLARNICLQGDVGVYFCTLDSSPAALLHRMLASMSSIESGQIATSRLTTEQWPRLGEAMSTLASAPLYFSEPSSNDISTICSLCKEAKQSIESLGLIIIDSLQLTHGDSVGFLKILRKLSTELNVSVLLTCQSKPSVEVRPGEKPLMHDLPYLEAMQTYPHIIAMLHREEFWNPDTSSRGVAELMFLKNTDNPVGTIRLQFEPKFSLFKNCL
jgi:replicative DNA helicase